ncbi:hypothetical protein ANANG_G00109600 [Anguilla anguilla]|uniref:C2H2-type domain-containing protein n=1 Tax=Anguilla anguilla TaxID=7936 RepID=A0A9D3MN67_ANGAN|nr:hypothetical protein ANANG_G00109600 [Anguilla anguilla]
MTAQTTAAEEKKAAKEAFQGQRVYRCGVCDYTSSSWIGVRNHQRIHSTEKPYSCCSCNFSTTDMNSLRSHMQKHPQEQPTVQLLEQYRCSLCGYACRHPLAEVAHVEARRRPELQLPAGHPRHRPRHFPRLLGPGRSSECRPRRGLHGPAWRNPDPPGTPGAPAPGTEYCVLLFCCCVCGFESLSKERLMEHMNDHQGEIISIILSRDQPAGY